jgi:hypothetical protein
MKIIFAILLQLFLISRVNSQDFVDFHSQCGNPVIKVDMPFKIKNKKMKRELFKIKFEQNLLSENKDAELTDFEKSLTIDFQKDGNMMVVIPKDGALGQLLKLKNNGYIVMLV